MPTSACLILLLLLAGDLPAEVIFASYLAVFFLLGALANGLTIAVIGFLMEISPQDRRPSYSGYFNALTAPAFLFPLLGGAIASFATLTLVFALSALAAVLQFLCVRQVRRLAEAAA